MFITHQINIKSPILEVFINKVNLWFISKFNECWIPDFEAENNLSGELSHGKCLPRNTCFIGPLSRFESKNLLLTKADEKIVYDLLVLISGPEPQRSIFEEIVLAQLSSCDLRILIVEGKTEIDEKLKISEMVSKVSHLTADELQTAILSSKVVLCRSGYSTVMDLYACKSKAIFVPTPGQPEQEYLGQFLMKKGIAFSVSQERFSLNTSVEESKNYSGFSEHVNISNFKKNVEKLLTEV